MRKISLAEKYYCYKLESLLNSNSNPELLQIFIAMGNNKEMLFDAVCAYNKQSDVALCDPCLVVFLRLYISKEKMKQYKDVDNKTYQKYSNIYKAACENYEKLKAYQQKIDEDLCLSVNQSYWPKHDREVEAQNFNPETLVHNEKKNMINSLIYKYKSLFPDDILSLSGLLDFITNNYLEAKKFLKNITASPDILNKINLLCANIVEYDNRVIPKQKKGLFRKRVDEQNDIDPREDLLDLIKELLGLYNRFKNSDCCIDSTVVYNANDITSYPTFE